MPNPPFSSDPEGIDSDSQSCSGTDADETRVLFASTRSPDPRERYNIGRLFLEWAWAAHFPAGHNGDGWDDAVRALGRTLRGLEGAGLIERRTVRRPGRPTHHGFVLTSLGQEALLALSGDWIEEGR